MKNTNLYIVVEVWMSFLKLTPNRNATIDAIGFVAGIDDADSGVYFFVRLHQNHAAKNGGAKI